MVPLVIYQVHTQEGSATDRVITDNWFIVDYSVWFDKGFNVQNLFLQCKLTANIPPFVRSKGELRQSELAVGK